ncbi:sugar 3,4-ketoisomerase [Salinibacter ruber]|uniref:sugar 3,4-ketoisomerase n=1 Tax=Salinibacter ruber TaxID=146919 RepID=UPI0023431550
MGKDGDPSVGDCKILHVPKVEDRRGSLSFVENGSTLPFDVARVFHIYDIPGGKSRGQHAHRECHEFLIAASGSFRVHLDDTRQTRTVELRRPDYGLHLRPGIWAGEKDFSSGVVCLVLTSHPYDEKDYIRDYAKYKKIIKQ